MQLSSSKTGLFHNVRRLFHAAAIVAALIIPSGFAQAGVIYTFNTQATSPGTFSGIPIYMEITDQAYADGVIDSWSDVTKLFARDTFITPFAPSFIDIVIGPDEALSGSFLLGGMSDTLQMSESAGLWKGVYSTDAPFAPCNISNNCKLEGEWEIAVPEPASLALLGAGLLGAALMARRRKRPAL